MGLTLNTDRYVELLGKLVPRPITSDEDFDRWAAIIESIHRSPIATTEEQELASLMLPVLTAYDKQQNPALYESDPLSSLQFMMDQHSMSQADLARVLGISRATASQICNGQRGISKASALKLAAHFHLPVSVFLS